MASISIILPTFNELSTGVIKTSLPLLCSLKFCEVIVVDGESTDGTKEFLDDFPIKVISKKLNSRAERINLGLKHSVGEIVLLHHPRSLLSIEALNELYLKRASLGWGAFTHKFDFDHPLLKLTSWYSNHIRGDRGGIFYLDHCLYLHRRLLENDLELVPLLDVFEDTALCQKLLKLDSSPRRLNSISTTSSIRFLKNGIYRQALLNQILKIGFKLNFSSQTMNRIYEKGLSLNSKY